MDLMRLQAHTRGRKSTGRLIKGENQYAIRSTLYRTRLSPLSIPRPSTLSTVPSFQVRQLSSRTALASTGPALPFCRISPYPPFPSLLFLISHSHSQPYWAYLSIYCTLPLADDKGKPSPNENIPATPTTTATTYEPGRCPGSMLNLSLLLLPHRSLWCEGGRVPTTLLPILCPNSLRSRMPHSRWRCGHLPNRSRPFDDICPFPWL
ncbi:hypothetical protein LZ31DRAFT_178358 [Colletotrichum somersetense]|nr:hypothetical protein LZ31DRAFT_178358 [Colletotrichum somersetense]